MAKLTKDQYRLSPIPQQMAGMLRYSYYQPSNNNNSYNFYYHLVDGVVTCNIGSGNVPEHLKFISDMVVARARIYLNIN